VNVVVVNLRSPREIALMRRAGLVVWGAHQVAREMVRPGVTTGEIDAAVESFFLRHGAIPLFKGVSGRVLHFRQRRGRARDSGAQAAAVG
jgi:methionyl aminopeptidase